MSDTPINLNRARKLRARDEKRAKADANAAKFGRNKTEKARDTDAATRAARILDQHKRDRE